MSEKRKDEKAAQPDERRRELLLKLGKVAVYTPPVLLTLLVSRKASAISPPGPP